MIGDERLLPLMDNAEAPSCTAKTEVWARVCGFFRPVRQWNKGKRQEYQERTPYQVQKEQDHGHR